MLQVLTNLLTLKALSTPVEVYAGLALVWLLMLAAGLASVAGRSWPLMLKLFWFAVLIFLPVAGMALYCLCCLCLADYSFLRVLGLGRSHTRRLIAKRPERRVKGVP